MIDRSDLLKFTLGTVEHNLVEGMILVSIVLFLFLLNVRAALIVALTIPFVCASSSSTQTSGRRLMMASISASSTCAPW